MSRGRAIDPTAPADGLPDDLFAQVLSVLDLPEAERDTATAVLLERHPEHAESLRRYLLPRRPPAASDSATVAAAASGPAPRHPATVGPYRIVGVLGEGGMGVVYRAEQLAPVRREVALKLIRGGLDSAAFLRRFELERQVLAVMNHEHIARVFDAGTDTSGAPYYVLEYVPGAPITDYCDRARASIDDRVRLFLQVCAGVQHAHQRGVIHRDLTPRNVLVTESDGRPVPKIIDFGLARATDAAAVRHTVFTEGETILGTWDYMSPEQADPAEAVVDTRTDIYALGALLYELLVGEVPLRLSAVRIGDRQRAARELVPARPSAKIGALGPGAAAAAAARRSTPSALAARLRGDLDWITLKCLEKDQDRRYPTVEALALDLRRHLAHEPVLAGPPSALYRLRKFVRRYRVQVAAAAMVLLAVVFGLLSAWLALDAQARRAELDQLAGVVLLEGTLDAENELYPAWPEQLPAMTRWLEMSRWVETAPWLAEDSGPLLAIKRRIETTLGSLDAASGDASQRFLRDTFTALTQKTDLLANRRREVIARRAWAQGIEAPTLAHRHARVTWGEARAAIARADGVVASTLYREHPIDLIPQMGLVPIGMNPVTRLWEFYELRSAIDPAAGVDPGDVAIPQHDPTTGHVAVGDDTGIVFVLLPGGTFTMGRQKDDPRAPNYDADALASEAPERVTLAPFFLARHELTQGQWRRLTGGDVPSGFRPGISRDGETITWAHPVEAVDWNECDLWLRRHGLVLPTEAQWEYGCRAGTKTTWWTGAKRESLLGAANLADETAKKAGRRWFEMEDWPDMEDGFVVHAPVDTLKPNAFGLHHVHGNVWEWCRDWFGTSSQPVREGDGERLVPEEDRRGKVRRGGSFNLAPRDACAGRRDGDAAATIGNSIGVRASRVLQAGG